MADMHPIGYDAFFMQETVGLMSNSYLIGIGDL